ncbi:annexin-like protein RJ4 [Quercus lobata]|uniref:annexin-like protein RJ4 n=1 Tax=Quercus lobata TaxID=97700 RepID=UPI0012488A0A|nr:annexin-like protein RJ4 [Quercus lobata]
MATIIVTENVSIHEDAEKLQKACKGWGTDEKAIINILGHRNAIQRKQIRQAYEELYQEDLIKRLESELSGDFEKAVYRWILDPVDRDAVLANVAIKKAETEFPVIIELSCIYSPEELLAVRRAYQSRYKRSLEEDVAAHTTGDLRKFFVGLVTTYRYDGPEINETLAKSEADILHEAIKDKIFNHEEVIRILTTRSKAQLKASFNRYRDKHGTSITKMLLKDESNVLQKALHAAIRGIEDPKKYYEKVLRNAIKRSGTDKDALTRVIVTRAEKDLKDLKELYYERNSVALDDAVSKETTGDYKKFLLTLLGKED